MQNLYEVITTLVNEKSVLESKSKHLLTAVELGDVSASDEYDEVAAQLSMVESQLEKIENKYAIDIDEMSRIISVATGKHYVPKFFREVTHINGKTRCTHTFAACFVGEENKYYQNQNREILLIDAGYHNLLDDIDKRNGIVQFSGSEMFETEQLNLKEIYEDTNFIKMFTQPGVHTEVNKVFEQKVNTMLAKHLKTIKVANVDENLGQGR